jgi:lysine biosynthesis protein LysW
MARCPECNNVVPLPSELTLYDQIYCTECGALLEVVGLGPPELEYVSDYEDIDDEDLEWDEWEDDEDLEQREAEEDQDPGDDWDEELT